MERGLLKKEKRIGKSNIIESMKHPIFIPKKYHVTMLIMRSMCAKLAQADSKHFGNCTKLFMLNQLCEI